jgi:large subunit ribosomal protein L21
MKYAIVESGGKQYKAVEGGTIEVDKLPLEVGKKVELDDILLIVDGDSVTVGTPRVSGAKISAKVVDQFKAKKIIVFKYKSRQRYRVKTGHRQKYTRLEIETITGGAVKKAAAKKSVEEPVIEETKAPAAEKPAAEKKTVTKKAATKKAPTKKTATKTAPAKKTATKKSPAKKAPTKKTATKKPDKK